MTTAWRDLPSCVYPTLDMHVHLPQGEGQIDDLIAEAQQVGVTRLILNDLGREGWPEYPSVSHVRQANERLYGVVAAHPGVAYGLVYVNPNHDEAPTILREGLTQPGIVGIKLWVSCRDANGRLDPCYRVLEIAQEWGVPVLIHAFERTGGNLPGELSPVDLVHLAQRYRQAHLIMAHLGGLWQRAVRVIRPCANILTDVSGSRAYLGMVEHAVHELGVERVLFGSDAPLRAFAGQLAKVVAAEIDAADKRRILWENGVRLFWADREDAGDR
ncbi:MAG: amidohydrolase family protein [Anaerolineae bacterium]